MPTTHGIRFSDSKFWVTHRRRAYGPFDYEWSKDFCGIELTYRGEKFGEYCSADEIFADLKPFKLPTRVVDVASIVLGCTVFGLLNGATSDERLQLIADQLRANGHQRFADFDCESGAA